MYFPARKIILNTAVKDVIVRYGADESPYYDKYTE